MEDRDEEGGLASLDAHVRDDKAVRRWGTRNCDVLLRVGLWGIWLWGDVEGVADFVGGEAEGVAGVAIALVEGVAGGVLRG